MADNLTHSFSKTYTSNKSTADGIWFAYTFTEINTSAASKIPPYSQINSTTAVANVSKNPTGSLSIGTLEIQLSNKDNGSADSSAIELASTNKLNYKSEVTLSANLLSYIKSKQSNAGYIECSGKISVVVYPYFVAAYNQQFTSKLTISWNYNEPRAIVSVSKSGEGTVTGAGTYHYGKTYTITATPASGYKFVKWSDGNTNASRTFTVNSSLITAYETSKSYQAIFEVDKINNIYIGTSQPKKIYFGTQEVKEVYFGTTKVYG